MGPELEIKMQYLNSELSYPRRLHSKAGRDPPPIMSRSQSTNPGPPWQGLFTQAFWDSTEARTYPKRTQGPSQQGKTLSLPPQPARTSLHPTPMLVELGNCPAALRPMT